MSRKMRTVEMHALREMFPPRRGHYVWVNYVDIELTATIKVANKPPFLYSTYFGCRSTLEKVIEDYWNENHENGEIRHPDEHCAVVGQWWQFNWPKVAMHDWPCTGRAEKWSLLCSIDEATFADHIDLLDESN